MSVTLALMSSLADSMSSLPMCLHWCSVAAFGIFGLAFSPTLAADEMLNDEMLICICIDQVSSEGGNMLAVRNHLQVMVALKTCII